MPTEQECIDHCLACHRVCLDVAMHVLRSEGRNRHPEHVRLLLDCAEICQTSAGFMLRRSDLHPQVCGLCGEVCEACADACDAAGDDAAVFRCTEICRRCAASCREMSKHGRA